jgi:hypothetical protein
VSEIAQNQQNTSACTLREHRQPGVAAVLLQRACTVAAAGFVLLDSVSTSLCFIKGRLGYACLVLSMCGQHRYVGGTVRSCCNKTGVLGSWCFLRGRFGTLA